MKSAYARRAWKTIRELRMKIKSGVQAESVASYPPILEGRRCRTHLRRILRPLKRVDGAKAADDLIDHFGSLRSTLAASSQEQLRACGDARIVRYLGAIRSSMRWSLRVEAEERTFLSSPDALRKYLRFSHGCDHVEQLRVFYMNTTGALLREVCFDPGSPDETVASVGQIIGRGLEQGACKIIMAHNHPSGDPRPSKADIDVTRKIAVAAHTVGMTLFDHLIVAEGSDFSFRENGLL
jgi:DNA repair protein RadC